ncbi:MAG TPA: 8-oxoguanine deaminase [Streptosporangiaceae bacterium]|nr:8-oxoguanine deaminase [Streptosporangiaceae bacterium]
MSSLVIEGCAVATVDGTAATGTGTEYDQGHLVLQDGRITAVGAGPAPSVPDARVLHAGGCLATPGLIGTHHHLFQGLTRGLAQDSGLVPWLTALYPLWARLDPELHGIGARAGLATLALSGCSATADHHYLFPRGRDDLLAAGIGAARQIGLRLHACRGSLDIGESAGGLPPDSVVEDRDDILAATERAIGEFHDGGPTAMVRVAVAPSTPFTVTGELMRESAELARRRGVRLHTHLAEAPDEPDLCRERFGCTPAEYLESLGWLGDDVWVAHGVHLDLPDIIKLGRAGTGVAHCPTSNARLGTGIAPVPELLAAGAPVGLGVDGAAANDYGGLAAEMRQSMLAARARRGADALSARQALAAATMGGARCLGRQDELGSLEVGKQADVALWRLDGLGQEAADPVWALVCGPPAKLELLTVGGRPVVEAGQLRTADPVMLSRDVRAAARKLAGRHGVRP